MKQFELCKNCKISKGLGKLNKKHFGHISSRAEAAKYDIKAAQLEIHDELSYTHLHCKVSRLRKEVVSLCEAERSFYFQQA